MSLVLKSTPFSPVRRRERLRPEGPDRRRPRLGDGGPDRGERGPKEGAARRGRPQDAGAQTGPGRRRGSPDERSSRSARVLIVDDEAAIRLICRVNLQDGGFEIVEAADGETGLALARSEPPDLILLDIMLPGLDGWSVAEELAADPKTADIPIVFLSARSDESDQVRGYEAGGVGYIRKPFDPAELAATVSTTLERLAKGEREALRDEWRASLDAE
jgi:CheY-like chemotaxis protein